MQSESNLEDILDTVIDIKPGRGHYETEAAQLRDEFQTLVEIVSKNNPQTIVEIGTAKGGTFYTWCRYIDSSETIISIDLPGGQFGGGYSKRHTKIFRQFAPEKDQYFIRSDSQNNDTKRALIKILKNNSTTEEKIDFLFIDGDHSYKGVKKDFELYNPLVKQDGIIAFHDITERVLDQSVIKQRKEAYDDIEERHLTTGHPDCNVHKLWKDIQENYQTEEIKSHPGQTIAGIGVLYK